MWPCPTKVASLPSRFQTNVPGQMKCASSGPRRRGIHGAAPTAAPEFRKANRALIAAQNVPTGAARSSFHIPLPLNGDRIFQQYSGPLCSRRLGDVEMNDFAPLVRDHDQDVEQAASHGRNHKEIHRGNATRMVLQKGPPTL